MLSFVPTPIGNLADITLNALHALHESEILLCEDTRVTKKLFILLQKNPIVQQFFPLLCTKNKQFISFHSHNQHDFLANITPSFFEKKVVFCTDAGMPSISDPGALLLQYVRKNNIQYQILLGGSAFSHAFVSSGLEGGFCFLGFLPHKQHERRDMLKSCISFHKDLHIIYYESPKRLRDSLNDIALLLPHAILYVYKELTKLYQYEMIGKAADILNNLPNKIFGEYCIIIQRHNEMINNRVLYCTQDDILGLDMSHKQKSKLLAQISDKSAKEWYAILTQNS